MTDFYSEAYRNAGPLSQPHIARSQYLADALRALQASGDHISSTPELGTRLLAQALLQYGQRRNERQLQNTTQKDATNSPLAQLFAPAATPDAGIGMGSGTTPTGPGSPPVPALAAPPAPAGAALGAALNPDPLANHNAKTADLAARLLSRESSTRDGQIAVGNVVRNRGSTGMDLGDVMTQGGQFEPWGNPRTRADMMSMPTTDPRYQAGMEAWQASANQQVAPAGAMNFYGPQTQAALGRAPPDFAQGGGQMIGGNQFSVHPFAPPQGYQQQQPVPTPPSPQDQAQPPPAQPPPSAGAPPVAPAPSGPAGGQPNIPQVRGMESIPPQQRQYIYQLLTSGNPQQMAMGQQMAQHAIAQAMSPPGYRAQPDFDRGVVIYMPDDPNTGQPFTTPIPGWHRDPGAGFEYGPDGRARPIPGRESTMVQGNTPGAPPSAPGTAFNRDALGNFNRIESGVPAGYMPNGGTPGPSAGTAGATWQPGQSQPAKGAPQGAQPAPTQPGGMRAIPGGPADVTNPTVRLPALAQIQQQLEPQIQEARGLFQNISSVRNGAAAHSGIGDLAIANGFQHLLDTGIVRQEDMNTQAAASGLGGEVTRIIQFVTGGGRLNDTQRAAFASMAERLYEPRVRQLGAQVLSRRPLVDGYGPGSFDQIVPPGLRQELEWEPRPGQHPQGQPHPQSQGLPTQARAALREGHNTTFGNGQTWTLRGGQPHQVR